MTDEKAKPLHEVFLTRARGVGHILRDRPVPGMSSFSKDEDLKPYLIEGDVPSMLYTRAHTTRRKHTQQVRFENITAGGVADVKYGAETLLSSEVIGSTPEELAVFRDEMLDYWGPIVAASGARIE